MAIEKKNVVLRGPLITQSGYGVHSRQIAKWLLELANQRPDELDISFQLLPWGMTPWYVDPNACGGLIGQILQNSQKKENYDISFQLQLPNEWDPFLAKTNVGITAAVETDRCNPAWVDAANRMDLIIVPSEFVKRVFENTGDVKTKIIVIPESWVETCGTITPETNIMSERLQLETDFNFLLLSQFTGNNPENDRKNVPNTIKWISEQFNDARDVGLVIKTNFGRETKIDRQNTLKVLTQLLAEFRQGPYPRIYLLHGHMTNQELASLYTHPKIKALVNLARGEGFGLPILEAAACKLPVVATGWSGHTDFLNQGKYIKVDYNLTEIHESRVDGQIWLKGTRWAQPDEQDAKRKLKRFHSSPSIPQEWAKDLGEKLQKTHSPEAIQKLYNEALKDII